MKEKRRITFDEVLDILWAIVTLFCTFSLYVHDKLTEGQVFIAIVLWYGIVMTIALLRKIELSLRDLG